MASYFAHESVSIWQQKAQKAMSPSACVDEIIIDLPTRYSMTRCYAQRRSMFNEFWSLPPIRSLKKLILPSSISFETCNHSALSATHGQNMSPKSIEHFGYRRGQHFSQRDQRFLLLILIMPMLECYRAVEKQGIFSRYADGGGRHDYVGW